MNIYKGHRLWSMGWHEYPGAISSHGRKSKRKGLLPGVEMLDVPDEVDVLDAGDVVKGLGWVVCVGS